MGIWFAIGLTHPEATSTLIHNFVFGWAMEWVFFIVELTTIAVYYYTWDRIDPKLHLTVGWVYAGASVCTLIIINGILTFMLTPGDTWLSVAGTGHEASKFWNAFFNPTYWPSLLLRTCVCASLAGIWALITSSRIDGDKQPALKTSLVQWSVKWLVPSFVATPFLLVWYLCMVPASQRALLTLGIDTINSGTFSTVTRMALIIIITSATIVGVAYFLAYRNPDRLQSLPRHGRVAAGAHRHRRRRVLPRDAAQALRHRPLDVLERRPRALLSPHQRRKAISPTPTGSGTELSCRGRRPATRAARPSSAASAAPATPSTAIARSRELLDGRDRANIRNFIAMLHENKPDSPYRRFMPPMVGTKQDIDDLTDFLNAQVNPLPPAGQKPVLTAQK